MRPRAPMEYTITVSPAKKPRPRTLPSTNIDRAWFDDRLRERGLRHADVAQAFGLDRTMVTWTLMGRRHVSLEEAVTWAQLLDAPVDEVMRRAGIEIPNDVAATSTPTIPVAGWVDEQLAIHWGAKGLRGPARVPLLTGKPRDLIALRFQAGPGMFDGALAYAHPLTDGPVPAAAIGRLCLVRIVGATADSIREVRNGYTPNTYALANLRGEIIEDGARLKAATPALSIAFR